MTQSASDSAFKSDDAASYDAAAATFGRLSEVYSASFAEKLLTLAGIQSGNAVLDLASGAGVVARRAAGLGARCVAVDLSRGMLEVAKLASPHSHLVQMDAERPAFRPQSFDAVVSLFGVLHFPDPQAVLQACAALLKPGGSLAIAFGSPAPASAAAAQAPRIVSDYLRQSRGLLLKAPGALEKFLRSRVPNDGEETQTQLASQVNRAGALQVLTRDAGFVDVKAGWMRKRFFVESPEEFWELQTVFSSVARKRLARISPQTRGQLRSEFVEGAAIVLRRGGALVYDVAASWILARAPAL